MKKTSILILLVVSLFSSLTAIADSKMQRQKHYNLKGNLAVQGYDPVAYFDNKATKGLSSYSYNYKGIVYNFSSQENLNKFKESPSKYEPQYGGWCAYALAIDAGKVKINPKRFKVIDGKLYLFYHTFVGGNTLKQWNKKRDDKAQINRANKKWDTILK